MEFKALQRQKLPRKWVEMKMQEFQHPEVWENRRSQEKRLDKAASKVGEKLSSCDILGEQVVNTGKRWWKIK